MEKEGRSLQYGEGEVGRNEGGKEGKGEGNSSGRGEVRRGRRSVSTEGEERGRDGRGKNFWRKDGD